MIVATQGRKQRAITEASNHLSLKLYTGFKDNRVKPMQPLELDNVRAAISGDKIAIRQLIRSLTPVIQSAVAHVLVNHSHHAKNSDIRSDVADHCQNIFIELFKNNSQVLKRWEPAKGMSLNSFVSLVAKRRVISSLRSEKYHCSIDDQSVNEHIDQYLQTSDLERDIISRHFLLKIINDLKAEISDFGYQIFVEIFLFEKKPAEVAKASGISTSAIYVWSNRLKQKAHQIAERLSETNPEKTSEKSVGSKRIFDKNLAAQIKGKNNE